MNVLPRTSYELGIEHGVRAAVHRHVRDLRTRVHRRGERRRSRRRRRRQPRAGTRATGRRCVPRRHSRVPCARPGCCRSAKDTPESRSLPTPNVRNLTGRLKSREVRVSRCDRRARCLHFSSLPRPCRRMEQFQSLSRPVGVVMAIPSDGVDDRRRHRWRSKRCTGTGTVVSSSSARSMSATCVMPKPA